VDHLALRKENDNRSKEFETKQFFGAQTRMESIDADAAARAEQKSFEESADNAQADCGECLNGVVSLAEEGT